MSKWRSGGYQCQGSWIRDLCVFGAGAITDLALARGEGGGRRQSSSSSSDCTYLFVNKFELGADALAVACWAEFVGGDKRRWQYHIAY